jgi:hypothetical protein
VRNFTVPVLAGSEKIACGLRPRNGGESVMRMTKLAMALVAAAVGAGVVVPSAVADPTGGPGEPTCQAEVISNAVREGTGRRAVAEFFFGDYPTAVQDAERAVREFCTSQ